MLPGVGATSHMPQLSPGTVARATEELSFTSELSNHVWLAAVRLDRPDGVLKDTA